MAITIKLSDEANEIAKGYFEKISDCDDGLVALSAKRRMYEKQMWETIKAEIPEAIQFKNKSTYNSERGDVTIAAKWDKTDDYKLIENMVHDAVEAKFNGE